MSYNPDEPRYTFGPWTMGGDGWPNCASNLPPPEEDEPSVAWRPECEEDAQEGGAS